MDLTVAFPLFPIIKENDTCIEQKLPATVVLTEYQLYGQTAVVLNKQF
jgi:hypothetical protein